MVISLIFYFYPFIAAAIFAAAYFIVRHRNRTSVPQLSYLAVFSFLCVVFNPLILQLILRLLRVEYTAAGNLAFISFSFTVMAVVSGFIALLQIRKSHGAQRGKPFAVTGLVGGLVWVGLYLAIMLKFAAGMANWR